MPANCKAGICDTPSFDAIHVVPHNTLTTANAKIAFALVPFLCILKGLKARNSFMLAVVLAKVLYIS